MSINDVLKETFGYDHFRSNQKEAIESFVAGRDTFVMMATGNGKSLCYQIPPLFLKKVLIVVSPLVSLMQDQVLALKANGVRAEYLGSHQTSETAWQEAVYEYKYSILYITPEKFECMTDTIASMYGDEVLCGVAFDECHCISEWGHDFRPAYRSVACLKELCRDIPIMCLTATATFDCQEDIIRTLKLKNPLIVRGHFDRPNLTYRFVEKGTLEEDFKPFIKNIPTIVYVNTKKQTVDVAQRISKRYGIPTLSYNGGMSPDNRKKVHETFVKESTPFIVATVAFGMGIDKPDIRQIIHYGVPKTIEEYYQQTGRAGRDGASSTCTLFWNAGDLMLTDFYLKDIQNAAHRSSIQKKIGKMQGILQHKECKRKYMLEYLGETINECSGCDSCADTEVEQVAVNVQALSSSFRKMLFVMEQTGDMFGANMLISVLRGSLTKKVKEYGFHTLECHGSGREFKDEWKHLLKIMELVPRLVQLKQVRDTAFYTYRIGSFGKQLLQESCLIPDISVPPSTMRYLDTFKAYIEEYARDLSELVELRQELAQKNGCPAHHVVQDAHLHAMVETRPTSNDDLHFLGARKIDAYGQEFLEHFMKQTVGNVNRGIKKASSPTRTKSSQTKKPSTPDNTFDLTLQMIDEGKTLTEIATDRSMNVRTIEDHISKLIDAQKIVDLTPYVSEKTHDVIKEVLFKMNGQAFLKPIKDALPRTVSYHEIKMVKSWMKHNDSYQ